MSGSNPQCNTWYLSSDLLVARRNINKGEEITYDYCLTESNPDWILAPKCLCKSDNCRGLVTGNDWKIKELQIRYANHFFPHILKKIQALNSSHDNKKNNNNNNTANNTSESTEQKQ